MNFLNVLLKAIAFVPSLVTGIEGMCVHKSGAEKKDAAMMFLDSAIRTVDAVSAREIVDPEKFRAGVGLVIDGVVQCLNASAWAKSSAATSSVQ